MKGGARIGAGRKKGQKDTKPRKGASQKAIFEKKAREFADFYRGIMERAKRGIKPTTAEKERMNALSAELAGMGSGKAEIGEQKSIDLEAPEYLRQVWNDPSIEPALRIRAAEIVLRETGATKSAKGKKDVEKDKAAEAGKGRFAPAAAPIRLVK